MSELRLAGSFIDEWWNFNGYGHFQIVFVPNPDNTLLERQLEIESLASDFGIVGGHWIYPPIQDHINNTPEYFIPDKYASINIGLGDRSADSAWAILQQVHKQFSENGTDIGYEIGKNSNSYATTLLKIIGVDDATLVASSIQATPKDVKAFPGFGTNVLENPDDAIALNLEGTAENDVIHTGLADDTLAGLVGNDDLAGSGGNDKVDGGDGNDTLSGGLGNDQFKLSAGNDIIKDFTPGKRLLIDFEGFGQEESIPNGYNGFTWNNFESVNGTTYFPPSGYEHVISSGVGVGYNADGNPASFTSAADFDLVSGNFAAAWNNDLNVKIEGWDDSSLVAVATLVLDPVKTPVTFNFRSIDEVRISSSSGTNAGFNGQGTQVAIDDMLLGFDDVIQVAAGTDIGALVTSSTDDGFGNTVLHHADNTLTLTGVNQDAVSQDWFMIA